MVDEWKAKGELLKELDFLRSRVKQLEQTEHKKEHDESKGAGQIFRAIFDDAAEGILLIDVENKQLVTGNKSICQILNYKEVEIRHLIVTDIYLSEDPLRVIEQLYKQVSGELAFAKDVPIKRKDGSVFYADINSVPLTFAGRTYLMSFFSETPSQRIKSVLQQSTSFDSYASHPLTETEIIVLKSIVKGMSNKEIAHLFHRSIRTIENHRAHIMKKLGVDSSVELVKRAVAMKLVDLPEVQ
jgi:PAS domain S-box-containing protein